MGQVSWNIAGNCQAPHCTVLTGRTRKRVDPVREALQTACNHVWPDADWEQWRPLRSNWKEAGYSSRSAYLELWTRCRKCTNCLRQRARLWRARAQSQVVDAARTWFITFTFNSAQRWRMELKARKLLADGGGDNWAALSDSERFICLHNEAARELTLWIKRVRKQTHGAPIRYLLVAEAHKDGFPHYHMLLSEKHAGTVSERLIRSEWRGHGLGFCEGKLVEHAGRGASYVCKYLAKSMLARVRASQRYGQAWPEQSKFVPNRCEDGNDVIPQRDDTEDTTEVPNVSPKHLPDEFIHRANGRAVGQINDSGLSAELCGSAVKISASMRVEAYAGAETDERKASWLHIPATSLVPTGTVRVRPRQGRRLM